MLLYRIAYKRYSRDPLSGEGSFLYGGRWSSAGTRMTYTSTTATLAMLEFLAQVNFEDFDPARQPQLVVVVAVIDPFGILELSDLEPALPRDWNAVPAPFANAAIGDEWISSGRSVGLEVPSIHPPRSAPEHNVLLNPLHSDFERITYHVEPFAYDTCLLAPQRVFRQRSPARRRPRR